MIKIEDFDEACIDRCFIALQNSCSPQQKFIDPSLILFCDILQDIYTEVSYDFKYRTFIRIIFTLFK
jgi:hypothetical protein